MYNYRNYIEITDKKYPFQLQFDFVFKGDTAQEKIETNTLINLLYAKPDYNSYKDKSFSKIRHRIAKHKYRKNYILPVYNKLLNNSPSFDTMCIYADFIRLLEKVFFYKNDIVMNDEEKVDKLISDSKLINEKKILILDLSKEQVIITFTMEHKGDDEVIDIQVKYNFGKKSIMNYTVVNREAKYDSIHSENLMITILDRLQKAMAKLFLDYYDKI